MPITINGTGTITGISAGGLPDAIITQPELAAGVAGNGPAFSAYLGSSQTPSNATYTKVEINTELFDTASCFDASTYRFTPNVAGYYQIQAACRISGTGVSTDVWAIYKNGSNVAELNIGTSPATFDNRVVSSLISMNGTTDYLEFYCYINAASGQTFNNGSNTTWFQGFLARAA
jgi:hypothetical protein